MAERAFTLPKHDGRQTKEATEAKILDATQSLLDGGASLAGLSVNRIVEAAGVSRATFYLHFGDKRDLVTQLTQRELVAFIEQMDVFFKDPDAGRDELALAVQRLVELWRDHAGVLASLIELAEYDAETREMWKSTIGVIAARVAAAIRRLRPDLSPSEAAQIGQVLAWTGERTCHQMVGRNTSARDARKVADALTEVLWRVIAPA